MYYSCLCQSVPVAVSGQRARKVDLTPLHQLFSSTPFQARQIPFLAYSTALPSSQSRTRSDSLIPPSNKTMSDDEVMSASSSDLGGFDDDDASMLDGKLVVLLLSVAIKRAMTRSVGFHLRSLLSSAVHTQVHVQQQ